MSIKLSYRDKVILIVLIVLVIIVGGIILFVRPQFEKTNAERAALEAKQTEQKTIQEKIDTLSVLQAGILVRIKDIDAYQEIFYTEGKNYEMDQLFASLAEEAGVDIASLTFETSSEDLVDYLFNPSVGLLMYDTKVNADLYNALPIELYNYMNGVEAVSMGTVPIGVTTYNVSFEQLRTWDQLSQFLDLAAESNKSVYVTSVVRNGDNPGEDGASINVKIYHIVPMDTEAVKKAEEDIAKAEGLTLPDVSNLTVADTIIETTAAAETTAAPAA
ncbi:MAG: hypothetical protein LBL87_04530 [Ruminococcus sp.]|jgi:hypothetical protein|nr:hypothetical protein [Ruminococcus sp.]